MILKVLVSIELSKSQTAAAHPAASRRGMRGAAAWIRNHIDLTHS